VPIGIETPPRSTGNDEPEHPIIVRSIVQIAMSTSIVRLRHARESQNRDRLATLTLFLLYATEIINEPKDTGSNEGFWIGHTAEPGPALDGL